MENMDNINKLIFNACETAMDTDEFIAFITKIYELSGRNYTQTARNLICSAPTVRRVVLLGRDSKTLRAQLGIKKSDRVRICFEVTPEIMKEVKELCERTGMTKKELFPDMCNVYTDTIDNMPYG